MAHYILHVGYGKTGMTHLQGTLAASRGYLQEHGILYPDVWAKGAWLGLEHHNLLGQALAGRPGWIGLEPAEYFRQFERQRVERELHTVLLSGETFMGTPQPWQMDDAQAYWAAHRDKVASLAQLLAGHEVTIVVYLRDPVDWLESTIRQTIRYEGLARQRVYISPEQYASAMRPRLEYDRVLALWEDAFGAGALRVSAYALGAAATQDSLSALIPVLPGELSRNDFSEPRACERARNTGWSRDVLEYKRALNRIPRPKYAERHLVWGLEQVASTLPEGADEHSPFLPMALRRQLHEELSEVKTTVARQYMDADDAKAFLAVPALVADDDPTAGELSAGRAVEIDWRVAAVLASWRGRACYWYFRLGEFARTRMHAPYSIIQRLRRLVITSRSDNTP